jgi:predicted transcriptional regulator
MPAIKTTTLTVRIDPTVKEGLRIAAEKERRSLANMLEVMIRDYCERNGVAIPEQQVLFEGYD